MNKMAKILMAFVFVLSTAATAASAYEGDAQTNKLVIEAPAPVCCGIDPDYDPSAVLQTGPDFEGAEKALYDGIVNCQEEVDITRFGIEKSDFINIVYYNLYYCYGELFHWFSAENKLMYYTSPEGIVTECILDYSMNKAEYERAKAEYDSYLNDIISKADPGFSDFEKILYIHDYLTSNYEYDTSYKIHHAYDFFKNKKGVCQAYTEAFCSLMRKMGIRTSFVYSAKMNHIWNIVELNGKWYQIDATHDDPVPDYTGNSRHREFLITDQKMINIKFEKNYNLETDYDWIYGKKGVKCNDDTYENGFWSDVLSPFVYIPETDKWYFINIPEDFTGQIEKQGLYIWKGNNEIELVNGIYNGTYNDFNYAISSALVRYKGKLYFNSIRKIYSYDLRTGELSIAMEYPYSQDVSRMKGFKISENDKLEYCIEDSTSLITYKGFSPYCDVNGVYGYYWDFDKLQVKVNKDNARIIVAWYDENGKQVKTDIFNSGEGVLEGGTGLNAKIMAVDENYKPLCPSEY